MQILQRGGGKPITYLDVRKGTGKNRSNMGRKSWRMVGPSQTR